MCDGIIVNGMNTAPNYLQISMLMAAMGKGVGGNQAGFRLLDMRCNAQKTNMDLKEIMALKDNVYDAWEHLEKLAQQQTVRS